MLSEECGCPLLADWLTSQAGRLNSRKPPTSFTAGQLETCWTPGRLTLERATELLQTTWEFVRHELRLIKPLESG